MAVISQAVESILEAASGVTNLIEGSNVFNSKASQDIGDCVIFQKIGGARQHAMGADTGLVEATFQVVAWASSALDAEVISDACRLALQDFTGTSAGIVIQRIFIEDDDYARGFDVEARVYGHQQEYKIWYLE